MHRRIAFLCFVFMFTLTIAFCKEEEEKETTWLEKWRSAVVTLGQIGLDGKGDQQFMVVGTGFLVYNYKERGFPFLLVTARHIFEPKPNEYLKEIRVRLHEKFQKPLTKNLGYKIQLLGEDGIPLWKGHPHHSLNNFIDIAVIPLSLQKLHVDVEILSIPYSHFINTHSLFQSDAVMCLGYPGNVAYLNKTYLTQPVLRSGIVAWISEKQSEEPISFLIDVTTYGGHSGGPVFLTPGITRLAEPSVIKTVHPKCVGLVSRFVPEIIFSRDTRGMFILQMGQNTGITEVVPTEKIIETLVQFGNPASLPQKNKSQGKQ